ncbi:MAG TPA: MauE/DoxX family redox-associated membrane protein [Nitrospiria bacterium]|nr:MauE/DoxX family redox-associated membrane protein [Nitrospiria bacterium]
MSAAAHRVRRALVHPVTALAARLVLGGLFTVSGVIKLIEPPENFMAAVHAYRLLPVWLERPLAVTLPWVEMASGVLLSVGLLSRLSLALVSLQLLVITAALASTLSRGISLDDCGCFGAIGFKESNTVAFVRNLVLLALAARVAVERRPRWTLDRWLEQAPRSGEDVRAGRE